MQRKCKKINYYRNIRYYRIGVKHAFAELKQYIKDIQMFLLNMAFILSSEVEIFIFHEWQSHE